MPETQIPSGWWQAPAGSPLTPTGVAKRSEVDNPYITKDEYIQSPEAIGAGINASSSDGLYLSGGLDKVILRASAMVNRFCGCYFDTQTIDEYRTGFTVKPFNPRLTSIITRNRPIQGVDSIYIQVLNWFIQVQTAPLMSSYLQIEPDWGIIKIVPLLSQAGNGVGSPIPAAIVDKMPLGVLWYTYTFGFGKEITGYELAAISETNNFQAEDFNFRLWAPDQTLNVYVDGTLQDAANYSVDYANGIVKFTSGATVTDGSVVTVDFVTNNTIPADIKEAVILLTNKLILKGLQNPMGFSSMNITGYSVSFPDADESMKDIKALLEPYRRNRITIV